MDPVINIENLVVTYGQHLVLDGVTLRIDQGEYIAIVGENGSGKSTLIKSLLGILSSKKGKVELFGKKISEFEDWHKIGYLPQGSGQKIGDMPIKVIEVIENSWNPKNGLNYNQRLQEVVELVDIKDLLYKQLSDLSGGQRQRVFIARSLINKPKLLLLDEPTSGIDAESRKSLFDFLDEISRGNDITIIHITHDLDGFDKIVDRTLCINKKTLCDKSHDCEHLHQ